MDAALEGGDAHLLARLKRDVEHYRVPAATEPAAAKLKLTAIPNTALRVFERAFSRAPILVAAISSTPPPIHANGWEHAELDQIGAVENWVAQVEGIED